MLSITLNVWSVNLWERVKPVKQMDLSYNTMIEVITLTEVYSRLLGLGGFSLSNNLVEIGTKSRVQFTFLDSASLALKYSFTEM